MWNLASGPKFLQPLPVVFLLRSLFDELNLPYLEASGHPPALADGRRVLSMDAKGVANPRRKGKHPRGHTNQGPSMGRKVVASWPRAQWQVARDSADGWPSRTTANDRAPAALLAFGQCPLRWMHKSCAFRCKHMTIRRRTVHGTPLFQSPRRGEFEQVRAPENRRTPARHNSIGALKMPLFPGDLTPGCQFSQLARWGVEAQKTLQLPSL